MVGRPPGQFCIDIIYDQGRGVEVDLVLAMHCYQKSAAQGIEKGMTADWTSWFNQLIIDIQTNRYSN